MSKIERNYWTVTVKLLFDQKTNFRLECVYLDVNEADFYVEIYANKIVIEPFVFSIGLFGR